MKLAYNVFEQKRARRQMLKAVCEREGVLDDTGYSDHHCFFRSEYFEFDWDGEWNHEPVRYGIHQKIHHGGGRKEEVFYKRKALARYGGEFREKLEKILKQKSYGI